MLNSLETKVVQQVKNRFPDTVEFLRDIVRQPSVLGNERGAQEIVRNRMLHAGLVPESWDLDLAALRQDPEFRPARPELRRPTQRHGTLASQRSRRPQPSS